MKRSHLAVFLASGALLVACASEQDPTIDQPDEDAIASWTGNGDGLNWSDTANWDRPLVGADLIRIDDAIIIVDVDYEIAEDIALTIKDGQIIIGVHSLLTNRGSITLDNGTITARNGGWFQNEGSLEGAGLIAVECNDGGSNPGSVGGGVEVTMGDCSDPCTDYDFNSLLPGEEVNFQFPDFSVTGLNNDPTQPQKVIAFDSGNPTGDDTDLATPGYGQGNDTAFGNLLIIPENDVDANLDGLVDDPDDSGAGGSITFAFSCAFFVEGLSMIDIEEFGGAHVELFNGGTSVYVANGQQMDDNSVQGLDFTGAPPADTVVVTMTGSGAIDNFRICPTHESP